MTKKIIIACIGVLITPLFAFAQFWELGIMVGGSAYNGELTPGLIDMKQIHPAGGALVRANITKYITVKGNVYYGEISGTDADATTAKNKARNLSFRSTMLDIGANCEINLMGFVANSRIYTTSPYFFIGLSVFSFDPQAFDSVSNQWVRLQPLGTEGQGTPRYNDRQKYALTQISIPFGLGLKHNFSEHWNIGLEFGVRKTFTDYLDDISSTYVEYDYLSHFSGALAARMSNRTGNLSLGPATYRGNPQTNDWYMFGGITLTYTIIMPPCYRF